MQQLSRSRAFSTCNFAATTCGGPSTYNRAHGNCKRGFSINEAPCAHDTTHEATSERAEAPIDPSDKFWSTACGTPYTDRGWWPRNCSSDIKSKAWRFDRQALVAIELLVATSAFNLSPQHATSACNRGQRHPRPHNPEASPGQHHRPTPPGQHHRPTTCWF